MKHFAVAELVIEAGIKYDEILEVRIEHRRNEYASAIIRLKAETKEAESLCVGEKPTGITIKTNGEKGNITIFSGVCSNFTAHEFDSYGEIIIEAKSLGYLFDRKNVSRKFRRPANVQELLAALLESYPKSNITVRNNNIKLKKIEAQNDETDWEYLLRLAGTTNQILYDDITAVKPNLYIGMPGTSVSGAVLEELTEIHDLDEYCKVKGTVNKDADETEYIYHCYGVSDGIACVGQTYKNEIIIESVIWSDKGIIQHTVVTTDKNVKNSTYDNSPLNTSIKSCILSGTVVSIEGTHLQVALDVKTDLGNENDSERKESFDANGIDIKSEDKPGTSLKVDTKQKKSLVDVEKYVWISQESQYSNFFYSMPDIVLFVTLPTSNYPKILQIKRRYSLNYSDVLCVRLF